MDLHLNRAQITEFEEKGYLVAKGLLAPDEIARLLNRLGEYAGGERPATNGIVVQIEPRVERNEITAQDRAGSVRKIDNLVPGDGLFTQLALNPTIVSIMQSVLGPNLQLYRSAALMKPPGIGSQKGVHQDSPYWPIEPMNLVSCWIAFDRATVANGCMTVIPGSHRLGPLPHVEITDDYVIAEEHYRAHDLIPVEMEAGTGLVFHSLLIHGTAPNRSPFPRRAITLSYMSSLSYYTGPEPVPEFFRISGEDRPLRPKIL
jgi:phytanoyl-CoA hydroxylase